MTPNTKMVINHTFTAVRVFDYTLTPLTFNLQIHCCVPNGFSPSIQSVQDKAAISFQVLKLWLHNMLDEVTIVNPVTDIGEMLLGVSESKIMTTPGEPDDNVLVRVLHSKIASITKGNLEIIKLVLSSSDTEYTEQHWPFSDGVEYMLPDISYMDDEVIHKDPWWVRTSIDIADIYSHLLDEEEIKDILDSDDMLSEYELTLIEDLTASRGQLIEAEIIEDVWEK